MKSIAIAACAAVFFITISLAPARAQVGTGSYTETMPSQACFTFSGGTFVSITSGACSSTCSINIDFDFSPTTGCDIVALEEELP